MSLCKGVSIHDPTSSPEVYAHVYLLCITLLSSKCGTTGQEPSAWRTTASLLRRDEATPMLEQVKIQVAEVCYVVQIKS